MDRHVAGLDLSLTATGWATALDTYGTETEPAKLRGVDRLHAWRGWLLDDLLDPRPGLVVIEGYAYGRHNQAHQIGELGGIARLTFRDHYVNFAEVPPATLKKWATGRGNATKPDMRVELFKRSGLDVRDDNTVDALWLLAAGRQAVGDPLWPMPKANVDALAGIDWPVPVTL